MRLKSWIIMAILLAACGGGGAETTTTTTSPDPSSTSTSTATTSTSVVETTTTGEATTTTAASVLIRVEGGVKVEGPDTISVAQGEVVSFEVVADVADEVHVHGYDLFFETVPEVPLRVEFIADATGIFEVELEETHLALVNIEVTP
jgi:plastocyanin